MKGNDFVAWMLRSPFHGLMANTMLITVRGRRSGNPITTPVNYFRRGDTLWVLTTRTRKWWRNIDSGSRVKLRLQGRDLGGTAELLTDETAVAAQIAEYVRELPLSARPLGVRLVNGDPTPQDTARLAGERLFVKICLE